MRDRASLRAISVEETNAEIRRQRRKSSVSTQVVQVSAYQLAASSLIGLPRLVTSALVQSGVDCLEPAFGYITSISPHLVVRVNHRHRGTHAVPIEKEPRNAIAGIC